MSKCVWLIYAKKHSVPAEYSCSENFGTLVSLDGTSVTRVGEYLNHVKARSFGITQVNYRIHLVVF